MINERWFGHIERIKSEELVKEVYVSETVGPSSRGRPLGSWKNRVKEYMCERYATRRERFEPARRECSNRERWRHFCNDHHLCGTLLEEVRHQSYW